MCSKEMVEEDTEAVLHKRSCTKDEAEGTGDSRPVACSGSIATNDYYSPQLAGAAAGMIIKEPKLDEDADINTFHPCPEESMQVHHQHGLQKSSSIIKIPIQEICDEVSVVSYRLIGHMLDKFLQAEGRDADAMTRYYLRGGSSPPADSQDSEDALNNSNEDTKAVILIWAVEEVLPSLPKSCIERMQKLMVMP